jgi:thiosulfate/3-mercaptopyruvate sulfurtransferase
MKTATTFRALMLLALFALSKPSFAQNPVNWTKEQLLEPQELAQALQTRKNVPVIISVGPGALIPGSIVVGPVQEKENLERLTKELKAVDKDAPVVVYCGCCPFEHCPNVRPAIDLLKSQNFTHYKLLNLPHNLKTDWLDKGYPKVKL